MMVSFLRRFIRIWVMILVTAVGLACTSFLQPTKPISKVEVEKRIKAWYNSHTVSYDLRLNDKSVKATMERYHPERPDERNDLIVVRWKGMRITLKFNEAIADMERSKIKFQEQFSYVVLDDIYSNIVTPGWKIHPRSPQSSKKGGVTFTTVSANQIAFELDWEIYTVFSYRNSARCNEAMGIHDGTMPENCYAGVEQKLPIHFVIDTALPQE